MKGYHQVPMNSEDICKTIQARLAAADWYSHLPWVLLGLRSAPREDSALSAAEAVYG